MTWLVQNWNTVISVVSAVISAASVIVRVTPTRTDDEFLDKLIAVFNIIALNKPREKVAEDMAKAAPQG